VARDLPRVLPSGSRLARRRNRGSRGGAPRLRPHQRPGGRGAVDAGPSIGEPDRTAAMPGDAREGTGDSPDGSQLSRDPVGRAEPAPSQPVFRDGAVPRVPRRARGGAGVPRGLVHRDRGERPQLAAGVPAAIRHHPDALPQAAAPPPASPPAAASATWASWPSSTKPCSANPPRPPWPPVAAARAKAVPTTFSLRTAVGAPPLRFGITPCRRQAGAAARPSVSTSGGNKRPR